MKIKRSHNRDLFRGILFRYSGLKKYLSKFVDLILDIKQPFDNHVSKRKCHTILMLLLFLNKVNNYIYLHHGSNIWGYNLMFFKVST